MSDKPIETMKPEQTETENEETEPQKPRQEAEEKRRMARNLREIAVDLRYWGGLTAAPRQLDEIADWIEGGDA